jgi:hypothetical protein
VSAVCSVPGGRDGSSSRGAHRSRRMGLLLLFKKGHGAGSDSYNLRRDGRKW